MQGIGLIVTLLCGALCRKSFPKSAKITQNWEKCGNSDSMISIT
jgi:hypothetical protein